MLFFPFPLCFYDIYLQLQHKLACFSFLVSCGWATVFFCGSLSASFVPRTSLDIIFDFLLWPQNIFFLLSHYFRFGRVPQFAPTPSSQQPRLWQEVRDNVSFFCLQSVMKQYSSTDLKLFAVVLRNFTSFKPETILLFDMSMVFFFLWYL